MKIIEKYRIIIPENKIKSYLLSIEHPIGRYKAEFFMKCGFHVNQWEKFKEFIYSIAITTEISEIISTQYGTKFIIIGTILVLNEGNHLIKTIWINPLKTKDVIFITAYPI